MFVCSVEDLHAYSNGKRSFAAGVYYNRLCQRIIGAMTSMNRGGRLYEVDTRLRPSGADGSLAVSIEGFDKYFRELAWTFEFMSLSKARVITGSGDLPGRLQKCINSHMMRSYDADSLAADIDNMRKKVEAEFASDNPWNVKYVRGGLMDVEFIAQYFVILHARKHPELLCKPSSEVFNMLDDFKFMEMEQAKKLKTAAEFLNAVLAVLRLCGNKEFRADTAPAGMKTLLARLLDSNGFEEVEKHLLHLEEMVRDNYSNIIATKHS